MDAFCVVHILNKLLDVVVCVFECLVVFQIHLLYLERFKEALGKCILPWIACLRHADKYAVLCKAFYIQMRRILDSTIRMVNKSIEPKDCALSNRTLQC